MDLFNNFVEGARICLFSRLNIETTGINHLNFWRISKFKKFNLIFFKKKKKTLKENEKNSGKFRFSK